MKNNNLKFKNILFAGLIVIIGIIIYLVFSFSSGQKSYISVCGDGIVAKDSLSYESCDNPPTIVVSENYIFIITIFVFQVLLILFDRNLTKLKLLKYYLFSIGIFLFFLLIEQILLNNFLSLDDESWQDVAWLIQTNSNLVRDFLAFDQRPIAVYSDILISILFSIITTLGVFISGLILRKDLSDENKKLPKILLVVFSIIFQIIIYIITFPVGFWFLLNSN